MTALEPDLGLGSPLTPLALPTITNQARVRPQTSTEARAASLSPFGPRLPDELQTRIDANLSGKTAAQGSTPAIPTTGLDTSAVILNLPNARATFVKKYERLDSFVKQLPEPVRNTLIAMDRQRVERGQSPLNDQETLAVSLAAAKNAQVTKEPKDRSILGLIKSLPSNALRDTTTILKSLHHMPGMMVKEVKAMPGVGEAVDAAIRDRNPLEFAKAQALLMVPGAAQLDPAARADIARDYATGRQATGNPISAMLSMPGARMVPGAFVVGQAAQGTTGLRNLAEHPVMTGLDVLPYANKLAGVTTDIGRVAVAEAEEAGLHANPIRALLTRKLTPEGEPSLTGSQLEVAKLGKPIDAIARTRGGALAVDAFSHPVRKLATIVQTTDARLQNILMGDTPLTNPNHMLARESYKLASTDLAKEYPSLTDARRAELTTLAQKDKRAYLEAAKGSAEETAFVRKTLELTDRYRDYLRNTNKLAELGGEFYTTAKANQIGRLAKKLGVEIGEDGSIVRNTAEPSKVAEEFAGIVDKGYNDAAERIANGIGDAKSLRQDQAVVDSLTPVRDLLNDYRTNPDTVVTLADIERASRPLFAKKVRAGTAVVGTGVVEREPFREVPQVIRDLHQTFTNAAKTQAERVKVANPELMAKLQSRADAAVGKLEEVVNRTWLPTTDRLLGKADDAKGGLTTAAADRQLVKTLEPLRQQIERYRTGALDADGNPATLFTIETAARRLLDSTELPPGVTIRDILDPIAELRATAKSNLRAEQAATKAIFNAERADPALRFTDAEANRHGQLLNDAITEATDAGRKGEAQILSAIRNNPDLTYAQRAKLTQRIIDAQPRTVAPAAGMARGDARISQMARVYNDLRDGVKNEQRFANALAKAPDRWHPEIQRLARERATEYLIQSGIDPERAAKVVLQRDFHAYPDVFTKATLDDFTRDLEPIWRDLKAAGQDPVFVHHVPVGRERSLAMPRHADTLHELSAAKARNVTTPGAYVNDITVGLAHQGLEIVVRDISSRTIDQITSIFGRDEATLMAAYRDQAERAMAKNPLFSSHEGALLDAIKRDWVKYEPEGIFKNPAARVLGVGEDNIWLPKSIARNMDRYYQPKVNGFLGVIAPITGVFRMAVLPMSPRWHINNVIGNAMILTIENGPGVFRNWNEARDLIKRYKAGEDVLPEQVASGFNVGRKELSQSEYDATRGQRGAELWNQVQKSKPKRAWDAVVQKLYDINSFFDDTSRAMQFLETRKKALNLGKDVAAADRVAIETVNRVFQNWNAMTPVERDILRQVFPFYSFTSYSMRYVMSFPVAHPMRAAVMSNLARSVMDDQGDGLPLAWLDYIGVGKEDADGNKRAISMRGLNPFGDTADMFTLAGFLSGLNPVGQAVAARTGADLSGYQQIGQTYDRDTGRLVKSRPGFGEALISATVPQAGFLNRLLGRDEEYNTLLRNDPDAARRLLVSGIGVPTAYRTVNERKEIMRGELNRLTNQRQVFKDAMLTGDYSEARKWPTLQPYIKQLELLRDQQGLTQYNPVAGPSGGVRSLPTALRSVTPWPT